MPKHYEDARRQEITFTLDEVAAALANTYSIDAEQFAWGWLETPDHLPTPLNGRLKVFALRYKDEK